MSRSSEESLSKARQKLHRASNEDARSTSSSRSFEPSPSLNHSSPHSPTHPPWNYEATVQEVELIIQRIESGDLDLEAVFHQFSEAVAHLQACEAFLQERQAQMDVLIETLMDEKEF